MRWIGLIVLMLLPCQARAQSCIQYNDYLGWRSGSNGELTEIPTIGVAIGGSLAYALDSIQRLRVYDCSDIVAPELLGEGTLEDDPGAVDMTVAAGFLFLVGEDGYLRVIDVRDSTTPQTVHRQRLSSSLEAIRIRGDRAYVAAGSNGGVVLDLSTPSEPFWTTRITTSQYMTGIDAQGALVYLAEGTAGLRIVDVSNPAKLSTLGSYVPGGDVSDVVVDGEQAYLAVVSYGVTVLDVSDPTTPVYLARVDFDCGQEGIELRGGYVFAKDGSSKLTVVDVRDPVAPKIAGLMRAPWRHGFAVGEGWAAFDSHSAGVQFVATENPESPSAVGQFKPTESVLDVAVNENYAYLALGNLGVQVIDISDPSSPTGGVLIATPGRSLELTIHDSFLYVADHDGLFIADLVNPAFPQALSYFAVPGSVRHIAVEGTRAYVTGGGGIEFYVVDIRDPSAPSLSATVQVGDRPGEIEVHDGIAYVFEESYPELTAYDVSDPTTATRLGQFNVRSSIATGFGVEGDLAYLTLARYDNEDGSPLAALAIVDISNFSSPVLLARLVLPSTPLDVLVHQSIAYVISNDGGLYVIDVHDPSNPMILGNLLTSGNGRNLALSGDLIFVADGPGGLQILPTQCPTTVPVLISGSRHWFKGSVANLEWTLSPTAAPPKFRLHAELAGSERPIAFTSPWAEVVQARDDLSMEVAGALVTYVLEALNSRGTWDQLASEELVVPSHLRRFALQDAIPNPFNPSTTITYSISRAGQVELKIYDLAGRHVSTLVSEHLTAGEHQIRWSGHDDSGAQVASGVYLYQFRAGDFVETKRMVLLK